jgi:hypothetical protein
MAGKSRFERSIFSRRVEILAQIKIASFQSFFQNIFFPKHFQNKRSAAFSHGTAIVAIAIS